MKWRNGKLSVETSTRSDESGIGDSPNSLICVLQFAIWEKRLDGKSPAAATKIQTLARKVSVFSCSFFFLL